VGLNESGLASSDAGGDRSTKRVRANTRSDGPSLDGVSEGSLRTRAASHMVASFEEKPCGIFPHLLRDEEDPRQ
jgi:hypothetical protein